MAFNGLEPLSRQKSADMKNSSSTLLQVSHLQHQYKLISSNHRWSKHEKVVPFTLPSLVILIIHPNPTRKSIHFSLGKKLHAKAAALLPNGQQGPGCETGPFIGKHCKCSIFGWIRNLPSADGLWLCPRVVCCCVWRSAVPLDCDYWSPTEMVAYPNQNTPCRMDRDR